jgi:2,4'-dihydroxyacetophenone dioxygenase
MAMTLPAATEAVHIGEEEIPFVTLPDGSQLKILQVRRQEGLWIIRTKFNAGYQVQTHRHTGPVWGYTVSGAWKYKEYDYVNRAGSFLYEPAGSVHTLTVLPDNTEVTDVWFHMYGANLNLDADGNIESVTDGMTAYAGYMAMCEHQGLGRPNVLVD